MTADGTGWNALEPIQARVAARVLAGASLTQACEAEGMSPMVIAAWYEQSATWRAALPKEVYEPFTIVCRRLPDSALPPQPQED